MIRKFFGAIIRFLLWVYVLIPIITLILSLCVWYFAPFIGSDDWRPFDSVTSRVVTIVFFWLIAIVTLIIIFVVRRGRNKKLADDIVETVDVDPGDEVVKQELGEMRDKLRTAMAALRKTKGGRKQLYELPWYVMIGPPGAGKTTAIVNSGLRFPLAEQLGKASIDGVGGTRNCDWWFTDNAVLIDTAGRYTTQESDEEVDNAAWLGFLNLLKKHRKRQPINGAIIAISLSDLSLQDEVTQLSHAKAVRRRLHELREKLGVRFPVYIIFTKADLIAGFSEFFDTLGKEEREQVWGFTLPLDNTRKDAVSMASFDEEFGELLVQLNAQSLEKMQSETDHQRRSLISGFPSQVASVRSIARTFLNEVFQDNRYEQRHLLRGVYFASGTQEGTPIDRLMMGMAKTFGIGRQAIGSGTGSGRSYFLTRLFEGVMFPEAGLVSADDKAERRYRWTKRLAIAATLLFAAGAGTVWTRSYFANQQLLVSVQKEVDRFQVAAANIPGNPIGDTDLPGIVDALNILRDIPVNPISAKVRDPDSDEIEVESVLTYGLYQGELIGNQAGQTYRAALNERLLPRLLLRLEDQLQGNLNNPDLLYEALKIYLMLGLQGPMNTEIVEEWMVTDWSIAYQGRPRAAMRADLLSHVSALLSQPMKEVGLNGPLVEQVQSILIQMPLAQRVYAGIINSPAAVSLPDWKVTEFGGPAVGRVFLRASSEPLNKGIEGIFTYRGFNEVFVLEAEGVAETIRRDSWVLGPQGESLQSENALNALKFDVLDLYYDDYVAAYDTILADLNIIPLESLNHAVEVTNVLSGSTSPMVKILEAVARETKLTDSRDSLDTGALQENLGGAALEDTLDRVSIRQRIVFEALIASAPVGDNGEPAPLPGAYVEDRFAWLATLTERLDGNPSQLDDIRSLLTQVYQELNKQVFRGSDDTEAQAQAILRFQQAAARFTEGPLERWSTQITTGSSIITADGTRTSINARWQSQVLPFCKQSTTNRYPINRRAGADMGMQDFIRLFGPNGLIDTFFNENLEKHVDKSTLPWTWKTVSEADLGISDAVLLQMQFAAEIRSAFFANGPTPLISFTITPAALDPKAQSMLLEIDGQKVEFKQGGGQPSPVGISWPGTAGIARLIFLPAVANAESVVSKDGPWAWFRMLDSAEVRKTNLPDRKRLIFNVGGRIAIFQLLTSSSQSPFTLAALSKFKCPESF